MASTGPLPSFSELLQQLQEAHDAEVAHWKNSSAGQNHTKQGPDEQTGTSQSQSSSSQSEDLNTSQEAPQDDHSEDPEEPERPGINSWEAMTPGMCFMSMYLGRADI